KYDAAKKSVELSITQKHETLFEFPLEVSVDGKTQSVSVKNKVTTIQMPLKKRPSSIVVDPNVNLLAGFDAVKEEIQ
ncbi:MAG: hypothetical protein ACXVAU_18515, partial [Mucilaginibacter sp.]